MRLYHSPGTRSTRVLWALEELGVPYDITVLTLDERRGKEHRKRHPLGRVPVVDLDDGQTMFESAGICLHLADKHPDANLVPPPDATDRPLVEQWLFFAMTELEPAVTAWRRANRDGADETEPARRLRETAAVVDGVLAVGPWMLGESFTIVDIVTAKIWQPMLDTKIADEFGDLGVHTQQALQRPAHARADAVGRELV
jgi:glutathione S-transferase